MALKLFGSFQSTCTQRVILVLLELGIEYELIEKNMMKGEHKDALYIRDHHPFGRILAIEDDGFRLFESRAICRYLVAKYGSKTTTPDSDRGDLVKLALFEQAVSAEYSYFDPSVFSLAYEKMFKRFMGRGDPDAAVADSAIGTLCQCLDYYENILTKQSFVCGEDITLVDLYHQPWMRFFHALGIEKEIESRPAVK